MLLNRKCKAEIEKKRKGKKPEEGLEEEGRSVGHGGGGGTLKI